MLNFQTVVGDRARGLRGGYGYHKNMETSLTPRTQAWKRKRPTSDWARNLGRCLLLLFPH